MSERAPRDASGVDRRIVLGMLLPVGACSPDRREDGIDLERPIELTEAGAMAEISFKPLKGTDRRLMLSLVLDMHGGASLQDRATLVEALRELTLELTGPSLVGERPRPTKLKAMSMPETFDQRFVTLIAEAWPMPKTDMTSVALRVDKPLRTASKPKAVLQLSSVFF